jgi:DNA-binding CsgD family transcriptional regulator
MKLSEGTVRNYLSSLYAKLDVDSRTEAIFKAVELKLLQPINDIDSCAQEHDLNDREIEVLALVQEGLTNQQIADRIQLSRGTIRNYLHYAYKKLDVNTRAEAVFRAVRLGILNAIDD